MNIEDFKTEAKLLMKNGVLLCESGVGMPCAYWHGTKSGNLCISLNLNNEWLNVTLNSDHETGSVVVSNEPSISDVPLYTKPFECLPPVDAIFMFGSDKINQFLDENNWNRNEPFNDNFPNDVPREYNRFWQNNYPLYSHDVTAVIGGWPILWPDDDQYYSGGESFIAWTLRDCEPWVEIWKTKNQYHVKQRLT